MDLLKKEIFFKLKEPNGERPSGEEEFKKWRNEQKKPIGKWKEQGSTYAELQNSSNVGMKIPEGYIVIDIDDKEQAEQVNRLINYKNIKCIKSNTGKGKHFIFKDPLNGNRAQSTDAISQLGIEIDSRVAGKGYIAVKFLPDADLLGKPDGERFVELIDLDQIDMLPHWLEPIKMQSSEKAKAIVNSRWLEGTRDNNLMVWTNIIWNTDTDKKKELYEIIENINSFIMDKPLFTNPKQAKEKINGWLEYVDNAKQNMVVNFGDENQELAAFGLVEKNSDIDYVKLAKHLVELFNIAFYNGVWWMKNDKPWYEKTTDEDIHMKFISHSGNEALKAKPDKLFLALKTFSIKKEEAIDPDFINFRNGKLNWREGRLYNYDGDEFITFGIDVKYETNTKPNKVDEALRQWTQNHNDEKNVLMEFVGSVMYPKNDFSKGIILYGPSAENGKSTFLEMMTNLFDNEYITSMNLSQLESRFGAFDLIGKRLMQISELEDTYIEKSPVFKQVVGSTDYIEVEGKNIRNKVRFLPIVKFIGATNRFPRFGDQTNGIWRRLVVVPFNFKPSAEEKHNFDKKALFTEEAKERLVFLAIEGLRRYMTNRRFTMPERSKGLEEEMKTISDSVRAHRYDDSAEEQEAFDVNQKLSDVYYKYRIWCMSNGYKPLGRNNYKKHVKDIFEDLTWEQKGKGPAYLRYKKKVKSIDDILKGEG